MRSSTVKKQLGIAYNTARYKLNRIIMFDLAKRLGLLGCYRCGRQISSIDTFSVDHKEPWLHIDSSLFWNLDNVAFSHLRCNSKFHR